MSSVLVISVLLAPSLLQFAPLSRSRAAVRLQAVAEDGGVVAAAEESAVVAETQESVVVTETQDETAVPEAPPPTSEESLRALAASGKLTDIASLLKDATGPEFSVPQDSELRAQLFGSWKLLAASDADASLSGSVGKWKRGLGHTQTFRKPDPMAIFSGDREALFFMELTEVVADVQKGSSSAATVKGGFEVAADGVVESYTRREVAGTVESDDCNLSQSWSCVFLGSSLRVNRLADGGLRVYDRVDAAAAESAIATLRVQNVAVNPIAAKEAVKVKVKKPEVVDNRPAWQKRVDEMDGIKRTANGTPIINHGPPTN
jgi:hypothetical protein